MGLYTEDKRRYYREYMREYRKQYPEKVTEAKRKHRQKLRQWAFDAYGRKCMCCALADIRFLALDHINNDGAAHRKANNIQSGTDLLEWLRREKYPEGVIQVLCHNCNIAKQLNGGVCPHGGDSLGESAED